MENNNNNFFNTLKRIFSTNAVVKIDKSGKRKVIDTDDRQMSTNLINLRDRYTKIQRSFYEQQGGAQSMAYHQVRRELFRDFDAMDQDSIISSALDIYSDETSLYNEFGNVLEIKSPNSKVADILDNLFYDILNIESNLWSWTRNLTKYGDFFLILEIEPGKGIINVQPSSIYSTERIEGNDPENPNYVKFRIEDDPLGKKEYENYEIAHFRLLSDTNFLPYGKSMIENGRRLWKQLSLMEDAMLIHRIMRAPEKRVFSIDIGNISPNEVDNYMQKIINKMKKIPFQDNRTGDYNLKYNMQNLTEDFYLPVRGSDSGTKIDNLGGLEYSSIEDIDYLKNKLFAALKIPKAYLGYDETTCISPDTKIPLISGDIKMVSELITDFENGIKNYVYSLDETTNNIVPGEIKWAGMTRKNAEVIKVWLDNGEYIKCTPDHKFLKRDGDWVIASELKPNDSLMPITLDDIHKVERIEILEERIDTCDIQIPTYHNFGTAAGVIIHNSGKATLAAEDVRFARTIERIQRSIISELTKIAVVHLVSQGIDGYDMVNFELSLTNPSTIYEQEKVNLWSEKVRLANDMKELNMLSKDFIYDKIFKMSDSDRDEEKVKLINDLKDKFRYAQIESDGNDPAKENNPTDVEQELEELKSSLSTSTDKGGRPREGNTYKKDKHPYGRDPLGNKENEKPAKRELPTNTVKNAKRIAREYKEKQNIKNQRINRKSDFLDDSNLISG